MKLLLFNEYNLKIPTIFDIANNWIDILKLYSHNISMKKYLLILVIFLFDINVFAYSKYIIPGGETLGIEVNTDGIMVIGFYKINGKYNKSGLKSGDYIIKIGDEMVSTTGEMTKMIEQKMHDDKVDVTYVRSGKQNTTSLKLILDDGKYKTGLYVKSEIKGIGTLSYIDPGTMLFGSLGHEIIETNTSSIVEIKDGTIFNSVVTGIDKSKAGYPGSKMANFNYNIKYGTIYKNTKYGIFGLYQSTLPEKELMEVSNDITLGKASIYTVINGQDVKEYEIEIININDNSDTKNLTIKIIDEELLKQTGGVVQGMSGSPIIQGGKIVGVLTHVIVDNPVTGYGIFITNMLEYGENN